MCVSCKRELDFQGLGVLKNMKKGVWIPMQCWDAFRHHFFHDLSWFWGGFWEPLGSQSQVFEVQKWGEKIVGKKGSYFWRSFGIRGAGSRSPSGTPLLFIPKGHAAVPSKARRALFGTWSPSLPPRPDKTWGDKPEPKSAQPLRWKLHCHGSANSAIENQAARSLNLF